MSPNVAESPRLFLQPLTAEDHLDGFHELAIDPSVLAWQRKVPPKNKEDSLANILANQATPETPWKQRYAIMLKPQPDTGSGELRMVGFVSIVRELETGYKILPEFWGKGYMTEALKMFIDLVWSLDRYKQYNQLRAVADPENIGSLRVLEKMGFKKGEYKKDFYERIIQPGVKRDIQTFYLDRP